MALSDSQAAAAAKFNRGKKYSEELIKRVQRLVGVPEDGDPGAGTAKAIAKFQAEEGLTADGKLGAGTLDAMEEEWRGQDREEDDDDDDDDDDAGDDAGDVGEAKDDKGGEWFVDLRGAKRVKPRGKPKRQRKWTAINGICLHQTACVFSGPDHPGIINVPAHAMTFAGGEVALLNPPTAYMAHGHKLNRTTIGIEISALACGVEGVFTPKAGDRGPNTFWRPQRQPECQPTEVTDEQIEATKKLIRYYVDLVKANGSEIKYIYAHRQSAPKLADPGSRIWKTIALWAMEEFNLTNGPKPNWCVGQGKPIPTAWDPRIEDVPYSGQYKGY